MLSTIPTTILITSTSFVEPISSPKQLPSNSKNLIKESSRITTTKGSPPTLDIFTSRDFWLRHHKKYSSPFTQLQTVLTTAPISKFKSPTTISTTIATKPRLKSKISPPTSPQPPLHTPPLSLTNTFLQKKTSLPPPPLPSNPPPPLPSHQPKYLLSWASAQAPHLDFTCHPHVHVP